jgi:hypothetical protein
MKIVYSEKQRDVLPGEANGLPGIHVSVITDKLQLK